MLLSNHDFYYVFAPHKITKSFNFMIPVKKVHTKLLKKLNHSLVQYSGTDQSELRKIGVKAL